MGMPSGVRRSPSRPAPWPARSEIRPDMDRSWLLSLNVMPRRISSRFEAWAGLELDQHGPLLHRLAGLDQDAGDDARCLRTELVLHLHGLHDDDALAGLDGLARLDLHADDEAGHGGADRFGPGRRCGGGRGGAEGVGAFVGDLDVEGAAVQLHGPAAAPSAAG